MTIRSFVKWLGRQEWLRLSVYNTYLLTIVNYIALNSFRKCWILMSVFKIPWATGVNSRSKFSMRFKSTGNSKEVLRLLGMPRSSGSAFIMDFIFHDNTSKKDRENVTKNIDILIKEIFNSALQLISYFQCYKVFQYSITFETKDKGQKVLRIGFTWNRPTIIDSMFRELNLDLTLNEIISCFKVDVDITPSIKRMLNDFRFDVQRDFSLRASSSISFSREMISIIASKIVNYVRYINAKLFFL